MIRLDAIQRLKEAGLRATPQRLAVLETLDHMRIHPTAEQILAHVHEQYPEISLTTIYNTLEAFVQKGIVRKVKTERDSMRYDGLTAPHHHLYCDRSDRIEDYDNPELEAILARYFDDHQIPGFRIADIRLQIIGTFTSNQSTTK